MNDFREIININFISFGAITAASFTLPIAIYLFSLKKKSRATIILALSYLFISLLSVAYIFTFCLYHPIGAYHRWMSVWFVLPGVMFMSQFFFYFPYGKRVNVAKWFLIIQVIIIIIISILWPLHTYTGKYIAFQTDGQYWDFNEQKVSKIVAMVILSYIVLITIIGIWRSIVTKGKEKYSVIAITISLTIVSFLPGLGNAMIRLGIWSNEFYHVIYDLCTVFGWFITIILYLNLTKDRTSFMAKIIFVCYTTIVIILLFIGYFTLGDMEKAYNISHQQQVPRIILEKNYRPSDLEYVVAYSLKDKSFQFIDNNSDVSLNVKDKKKGDAIFIRADIKKRKHYKSYTYNDPEKDIVYEAGFSFLKYRAFIHESAVKLLIILAIVMIITFVGFRFFFYGALVNPLKELMTGLKKIQDGDLTIKIPIKVEDEIGFLTDRFNSMASTIKDYTNNLEKKVEERTVELNIAVEELQATNDELVRARDALWGEMELAKKIQTVLLPENPAIKGYDISAYMKPADEVGGDYYDVISAGGKDWLIIGDVSGHGVPAGLFMMMVQTSIHVVLDHHPDIPPMNILKMINKTISNNMKKLNEDKYMTITVLACHEQGKFYFSGLHQDIMIFRKATNTVDLIETNGIWIGIMDDIDYLLKDEHLNMQIGDTMLLFTDGITEAWEKESIKDIRDPETQMFGQEKLKNLFLKLGNKSPDEIKTGILNELENYDCEDDVTLVVLKRLK